MKATQLGSASVPIVLVAEGQDPNAIITRLRIQAFACPDNQAQGDRVLELADTDHWLDALTAQRWRDRLIPYVRSGLDQLGLGGVHWRVSLRFPDAAAHADQPCRLEGPSADAACLAALIASALGLEVRSNTLLTGAAHMEDQSLGVVGSLPEKLMATMRYPSIRRFIHPPIDTDGSNAWSSEVLDLWEQVCDRTGHRVRRRACNDLNTAIKHLIDPDSRVIVSLRQGWFANNTPAHSSGWVKWLQQVDDTVWQKHLDRRIRTGNKTAVRRLLESRVGYALRQGCYPSGFGACLAGSLRAVPAGRRRSQLRGTLIRPDLLNRCKELAGPSEQADAEHLVLGATGRVAKSTSRPIDNATPQERLAWLIEHQSDLQTSARIDRALDAARLSFQPGSDEVYDADSFLDLITSFCTHLKRHAGLPVSPEADLVQGEASSLLIRAYAREGGYGTALANALDHTHGGIRRVLDVMTDTLKAEYREAEAISANNLALEGHDLKDALLQAKELLKRLRPILPERFKDLPPEFAVAEMKALVHETIQAGDRIDQRLRSR